MTQKRPPSDAPFGGQDQPGGWPAVAFEERAWERDPDHAMSRTAARKIRSSYQAAIVPDIAEIRTLPLDTATLAELDDASRALTSFDLAHGEKLSNFSALLLRSEAAASSQIENLTASAKAIITEEVEATGRTNAKLIVANAQAMEAAIALSDRLDPDAIIRMHHALLGDHDPGIVGEFRRRQVWIGGINAGPFDAAFVPPHHDRVDASIDDLCRFIARDDLPALAHTAVAHAQFESIHPFPDGNGRTGRALIQGMLRGKGVTKNVTAPLSAGLLTDTARYFDALSAYRSGDVEPIAERFTTATFHAISNGQQLASDLESITSRWADTVSGRKGSAVRTLLDVLPGQPVVTTRLIVDEFGISESAAARAVERLVESGVLTKVGGARRNRTWAAVDILDALDRFAARSRRRL